MEKEQRQVNDKSLRDHIIILPIKAEI